MCTQLLINAVIGQLGTGTKMSDYPTYRELPLGVRRLIKRRRVDGKGICDAHHSQS